METTCQSCRMAKAVRVLRYPDGFSISVCSDCDLDEDWKQNHAAIGYAAAIIQVAREYGIAYAIRRDERLPVGMVVTECLKIADTINEHSSYGAYTVSVNARECIVVRHAST